MSTTLDTVATLLSKALNTLVTLTIITESTQNSRRDYRGLDAIRALGILDGALRTLCTPVER